METKSKNVVDLLQTIRDTPSSNAKLELLSKFDPDPTHQSVKLLKDILYLVYEPTLVFGIKKIPEYQPKGTRNLSWVTENLRIEVENGTKFNSTAGRDKVAGWLESLTETEANWFEEILLRDLNIGIARKTVEKAFGKTFLTQERYMRCSLLDEKTKAKVKYPALIQLKEDGQYVDVILKDNEVTFMSRNLKQSQFGNVWDSMFVDTANAFGIFDGGRGLVLQGEIRVFDNSGKKYLDRKTGNGLVQRVFKNDKPDPEIVKRFVFVLWDSVDYDDWKSGESKVPYHVRLQTVQDFVVHTNHNQLREVEGYHVNTLSEAMSKYLEFLGRGEEGAVLKNKDLVWKNGTSREQFKMKVEFTVDLKAVEFVPGDQKGKHADTFGSVRCVTSDGLLECNASGFKDKERQFYFDNPDEILGQIVEVKANDLIQARDSDMHSLFHPRFVEVRDKTTADDLNKVVDSFESITGFRKIIS